MRCGPALFFMLVVSFVSPIRGQTLPARPLPPLPDPVPAKIRVFADTVEREISPTFLGINLHPGAPRPKLIRDAVVQQRVRAMGIRTIRFPNGCEADRYNWKTPRDGEVTVEQFLDFCDAVGAEPYYTLNLQGGTDGLAGPVPAGASLDERIRYRHTAPNPCGNTDYHFGTLTEALELFLTCTIDRALAGKRPLRHYELGNENWGQAGTDWPPAVYGRTCEVYAAALRRALADAKKTHPQLAELEVYIVAVGFPSMGNNQDPLRATDRAVNVAWTKEMNRLAELKLIDAVQEHFYPLGNADGSTLLWTAHNLHNILCLRNGVPNDRLGGYVDAELAYRLPIEWTEWNLKCWGSAPRTDVKIANPGFESGTRGWTSEAFPGEGGTVSASESAARRGGKGALLKTTAGAKGVELRQVFSVTGHKPAAAFGAAVWIRTAHPRRTHVLFRQANEGPGYGAVLGDRVATQTSMWERVLGMATPRADTTEIELVIRLDGPDATAFVDEVELLHWPTFSGMMPLAAARFEQQLFMADALRELLIWPTPRTHLHHLFGNYPCPALSVDGTDRDNAAALRLFDGRIGDRLLKTDSEVAALRYDTSADAYATDFNALTPDVAGVPALAVVATRDETRLNLLLINRTSDRPVTAEVTVHGATLAPSAELRTLTGIDFDVPGSRLETHRKPIAASFAHTVPAHTAHMLSATVVAAE